MRIVKDGNRNGPNNNNNNNQLPSHNNSVQRVVSSQLQDAHVNRNNNNNSSTSGPHSTSVHNNNNTNLRKKKRNSNEDEEDGYNSGDEYGSSNAKKMTYEEFMEEENKLQELVRNKGFEIYAVKEDGNCLFRSVAHQIYGDEDMQDQVRENTVKYMEQERDHYSQYVTEDFTEYIARKRMDRCFGNNLEIQAISEIYNRPVEVYSADSAINIFHSEFTEVPIRLSYHHRGHYNSVFDPNFPTVGLGLGLPSFQPGFSNKEQVENIITQSEIDDVENIITKESEKESEIEMVESEIEKAIIEASISEFEKSVGHDNDDIEKAVMEESMREYWNVLAADALKNIDFSVLLPKQ